MYRMKKVLSLILISLTICVPVFAKTDKTSAEYLKNKKHLAIMNPIVENVAEKAIKKTLKKELGDGRYKVKFEGYTLGSMKKGIFRTLNITGKNLEIDEIPVPYLSLKSITDYNWIDFKEDPVKIKSDITFSYDLDLTEKSISSAMKQKEFQKTLEKVNKRAYPLFTLHDVRIRIRHNKVHVIMDYSLPLASNSKKRNFMVSTDFKVENGKIRATNVGIDNAYGNLPIDKLTNLINLIDPLTFTLVQLNEQECKSQIENVKIEDNILKVNGKIYVKGE